MRLYCRISAESDADLPSVWSGTLASMCEIVESFPAPVLVAGGARDECDPERGMTVAEEAIAAGCAGLVYGRTIDQSADPRAVLARLRAIVHWIGAPP